MVDPNSRVVQLKDDDYDDGYRCNTLFLSTACLLVTLFLLTYPIPALIENGFKIVPTEISVKPLKLKLYCFQVYSLLKFSFTLVIQNFQSENFMSRNMQGRTVDPNSLVVQLHDDDYDDGYRCDTFFLSAACLPVTFFLLTYPIPALSGNECMITYA